jgi:acetoin utilization deacetylase AcuC-like enzyme
MMRGSNDPSKTSHALKVFYTQRQTASANLSLSPSAGKPALVVAALQRLGLPIEIVEPRRAAVAEICLAHDRSYVHAVLRGERNNGFGNASRTIAETLPWTAGSMLSAAESMIGRSEAALSPTSGFHHAGWNYGGGFCTFNGLLVTALSLQVRGLIRKVAILDLDQHFGDGTRDIIRRLDLGWIHHHTYGADPATPESAPTWLESLPALVADTIAGCDLVLFQAGADPHIDDPLGGGLTAEQLSQRDLIVFRGCAAAGIPVVVTLAGGYQRPVERVVDLHVETCRRLLEVYSARDDSEPANPQPDGNDTRGGFPLTPPPSGSRSPP